jgi:hypothetical protein
MAADAIYDIIGHGYLRQRRSVGRIAAHLTAALGEAQSVLNVGADPRSAPMSRLAGPWWRFSRQA